MLNKPTVKARIHVEIFNECLNKFRILDHVKLLSLYSVASQMVYVASSLGNFQECLCVRY